MKQSYIFSEQIKYWFFSFKECWWWMGSSKNYKCFVALMWEEGCSNIIDYPKVRWLKNSNRAYKSKVQFSSVAQSCSTLWPQGLQHARPPCPSPIPGVYSNSCLLSWRCHPKISSSVVPFSSHLQSFPASGSFPMSQLLASGGQNIGVSASASFLPMNIQDWCPLGWTGWTSLQSKGL